MLRSRLFFLAAAVLLVLAGAAVLWRPSAPAAPPAVPSTAAAPKETAVRAAAPAPKVTAELLPPPPGYAGSEKCAECHEDEHAAWREDWHARALSEATPAYVAGDFKNAHYKGDSSEAWMSAQDEHFTMRTKGPGGALDAYPVHWVVGGKRMQDPITMMHLRGGGPGRGGGTSVRCGSAGHVAEASARPEAGLGGVAPQEVRSGSLLLPEVGRGVPGARRAGLLGALLHRPESLYVRQFDEPLLGTVFSVMALGMASHPRPASVSPGVTS
jgi:hypothetical protein